MVALSTVVAATFPALAHAWHEGASPWLVAAVLGLLASAAFGNRWRRRRPALDTTELMARLHETTAALAASEERYRLLAEALDRRVRTDDLTNLLNRREVLERIEAINDHGRRSGTQVAVLLCDVDHFKSVNDTRGHAAGDAVLQAVADRIRSCLRSSDDMGARIGGDELLVVLHGVRDFDDAVAVAETLRERVAEPIPCAGATVSTTISIGVTLARPDETADALVARADDALYRAKAGGRNRVVVIGGDASTTTADRWIPTPCDSPPARVRGS